MNDNNKQFGFLKNEDDNQESRNTKNKKKQK